MTSKKIFWFIVVFALGLFIGFWTHEFFQFAEEAINDTYDTEAVSLHPDTLYKSRRILVLKNADGNIESFIQTPFEKTFSDFKEPFIFRTKNPINYNSDPIAKKFDTVITDAYTQADSANFAGHYIFASWGCGSPCHMSAIVDIRTGNVYEGPYSAVGYDFRPDSKLLIVNPPDKNGWYPDWPYGPYADPEYYIFEKEKFQRVF